MMMLESLYEIVCLIGVVRNANGMIIVDLNHWSAIINFRKQML